eukprot:scaffold145703_cov17-Tisochrysis_lutea.AAC.1
MVCPLLSVASPSPGQSEEPGQRQRMLQPRTQVLTPVAPPGCKFPKAAGPPPVQAQVGVQGSWPSFRSSVSASARQVDLLLLNTFYLTGKCSQARNTATHRHACLGVSHAVTDKRALLSLI